MIWFLLACGGVEDSAIKDEESAVIIAEACLDAPTFEGWTKGFLRSQCQACHASTAVERYGAPESVYFDDYEAAVEHKELIASSVLERATMPPAGGVSEEEQQLLAWWLDCPF